MCRLMGSFSLLHRLVNLVVHVIGEVALRTFVLAFWIETEERTIVNVHAFEPTDCLPKASRGLSQHPIARFAEHGINRNIRDDDGCRLTFQRIRKRSKRPDVFGVKRRVILPTVANRAERLGQKNDSVVGRLITRQPDHVAANFQF